MLIALEILLLAVACVLAGPSLFLAFQCLVAAIWGKGEQGVASRSVEEDRRDASLRVAVLIPAHNEEQVLGRTLENILPQLVDPSDALVVADNCSDATASIARSFGASVVERVDAVLRGKGYALDFGVRHLEPNPPAIVVVLDADCQLYPSSIAAFRERIAATGQPQQALNLNQADAVSSPKQAVALFANRVINHVRPAATAALGMPCRLLGTGMAFPWETIRTAPLATGDLVEDLKLGIDLAIADARPAFCPAACVTSDLPGCGSAFRSQRTRWEHGHLSAATRQVPRLTLEALRQRRVDLLWTAIDLAVPPLSLLAAASLSAWIVLAALAFGFGIGWPALLTLTCAGFAATCGLALAWLRFCRKQIPLASLLRTPAYIAAKLPIYVSLIFRRQRIWVRTERGTV